MEFSSLKIRLLVLWIFLAVAWLIWLVIVNGATSESIIIGLAVFLLMAFLSVTLNRRMNIIIGVIFMGIMILGLAGSLVTFTSFNGILLEVLKVVIAALIVWYAYKLPKV